VIPAVSKQQSPCEFKTEYNNMINKDTDSIIGEEPILQFGFSYDKTKKLPKTHLITENADDEVEKSPLTHKEKKRLTEYEKDINEGLKSFVLVGLRLSQIKTHKLFRGSHRSFHQYCQERFGFGCSYAKRLMEASRCDENLKSVPIGTVSTPANESQARVVSNLCAKDQIQVAKRTKEIVGDREPTAKDFEDAKSQVIPGKASKKTAKPKAKAIHEKAPEPSNVIPMTPQPSPSPVTGSFVVPSDFHKGINLPTLKDLSETATTLKYIGWRSEKQAEREMLLIKLTKWLPLYAQWEQEVLTSVHHQEAA